MEVFTLLESLEEILESSSKVPFSTKVMVDAGELRDIIEDIRLKLPDELKQAKWVKEERTRIIQEAKKEGEDIVKEAENRIIAMIDEHEITRKAYDEKQRILDSANEMAKEMSEGTKEYADTILAEIEGTISSLKDNIDQAQAAINNAVSTIKNNRRELK